MSAPYRPSGIAAGLSPDQVVEAALEHIERHGYETLTMRKLATELHVSPMTIYRHVADKRALLSQVADHYFDELRVPSVMADWQDYLGEWFDALHTLMLRRPVLAHVMAEQPLDGPVAWKAADHVIGVLADNRFTPAEAGELFTALLSYTIGFTQLRRGRSADDSSIQAADRDQLRAEFPHLAEAVESYGRWLSRPSFAHGVRLLIEAWTAERGASPSIP
ncbi:TetR/AcrR family transcriptional regulator [Mycobacterium talmoniae]|uniref:Tetracycline repressor protein class E n=1 Tax=Mycobacterium talmoniae TaxID=1858794 RepID=A0A2S8BFC9_9MYCO|nr:MULTISPECIES: TetR/AcrR family transcriptional regulator C-terminal domain-containing protein [Mycobacterium]PQM45370.1 Tetracycline repressor protein class E [Mycobacterium talmoniae]TDH48335.1 TetR family transcriptional regulator [Mycobacterium eburneum]